MQFLVFSIFITFVIFFRNIFSITCVYYTKLLQRNNMLSIRYYAVIVLHFYHEIMNSITIRNYYKIMKNITHTIAILLHNYALYYGLLRYEDYIIAYKFGILWHKGPDYYLHVAKPPEKGNYFLALDRLFNYKIYFFVFNLE